MLQPVFVIIFVQQELYHIIQNATGNDVLNT